MAVVNEELFVVEVEGYEGVDGSIIVRNDRAADDPAFGKTDILYCIAQLDSDGILRFQDWGYRTPEEARAVLHVHPSQSANAVDQ
jgi:hypothetical protein